MQSAKQGALPGLYSSYIAKYNSPGRDFDINIVRAVVCVFFIWKLMSRDFGFYGTVPENVFSFYPIYIYRPHDYIYLLGLPILNDIATMHWIHWILPRMDPFGLRVVQGLAITFVIMLMIFGRGPRRIFAVGSYLLLIYLWGHLFLAGQDVDAVALYFGLLLVLVFSSHEDRPFWGMSKLVRAPLNEAAGRTISLLFLIFVAYYFASGVNKLTDLRPWNWFTYDLVDSMEMAKILSDNGFQKVPWVHQYLFGLNFLDYIGPPLVYVSHLITPVLFFYRSQVYKFFLFYALFHFMTFGVGIAFTGYIPVWFVLFPYHRILFGDGPVSRDAPGVPTT